MIRVSGQQGVPVTVANGDVILGKRARSGVTVMPEIVQQHVRPVVRHILEDHIVKSERVLERRYNLGNEVRLRRRCINQPQRWGFQLLELGAGA